MYIVYTIQVYIQRMAIPDRNTKYTAVSMPTYLRFISIVHKHHHSWLTDSLQKLGDFLNISLK